MSVSQQGTKYCSSQPKAKRYLLFDIHAFFSISPITSQLNNNFQHGNLLQKEKKSKLFHQDSAVEFILEIKAVLQRWVHLHYSRQSV